MEGHFITGNYFKTSPLGDPVALINGVASFTPLLQSTPYTLTAVFNPSDSSLLASTSAAFTLVVNPVDMGWTDVMTGDFNGWSPASGGRPSRPAPTSRTSYGPPGTPASLGPTFKSAISTATAKRTSPVASSKPASGGRPYPPVRVSPTALWTTWPV